MVKITTSKLYKTNTGKKKKTCDGGGIEPVRAKSARAAGESNATGASDRSSTSASC